MFPQRNDFDELGLKVQRAQQRLEQVRGVGTVNGIRVVVDAENRLLSVTLPEEDSIVAAYNAALADKQPQVDEAVQDLRSDPRFEAISTFADANAVRDEAEQAKRQRTYEEDDDDYYEQRNRRGWFES
ncbi:YbaB/EbfC family nucleoid-associated protein [Nocardia sp. BMG51109]|uniref:YbaB/EbfC family nucleoid-associated protein n=1 Tax=Nocardia sp. BMG51109 TaxID=1056816 RepID=UPI000467DF1F|nr:YbaB/EbfC family nucleoid-associated protein [Nocardia sp. BMG51109]